MAAAPVLAAAWARQQAAASFRSRDNTALARRLDGITTRYPHLSAPVAMALAEAGYGPDADAVKTAAELQVKRDAQDDQEGGWGWAAAPFGALGLAVSAATGNLKRGVRTGLAALDAPRELAAGSFRSGLDEARRGNVRGALAPLGAAGLVASGQLPEAIGQTRIGAATQVARETGLSIPDALNDLPRMPRDRDPAELLDRAGESWLPGFNSLAEKRQVRNARAAGQINGRATTYGRTTGALVGLAPGGAAHELMAGLLRLSPFIRDDDAIESALAKVQAGVEGGIDLAAMLSPLDPVGVVGGAKAAKARQARRFGGRTREVEVPEFAKVTARRTRSVTDSRGMTRTVTEEVPITVESTRPTVVFDNAYRWLTTSKEADRAVRYLAAETDFERLRRTLGRRVPVGTVLRLLDETDEAAMRRLLVDEMSKDFIPGPIRPLAADRAAVGMPVTGGKVAALASATFRRPTARWRQLAPSEQWLPASDPTWAVEQFDRSQRALRVGHAKPLLSMEQISKNNEAFARALTDPSGKVDPVAVTTGFAKTIKQALVAGGVPEDEAGKLTRLWHTGVTSQRNYWIDQATGAAKAHSLMKVDGTDVPVPSAHASAEMLTEHFPMLNPQEVNRALSKFNRLTNSPGWEGAVALGDAGTALFKFLVLPVRGPAWMVRNLSEAQARIGVTGLEGMMNSPIAALAWRIGDNPDSHASRLLGRAQREEGRGFGDVLGRDFRQQAELEEQATKFARAMEHGGGPWLDDTYVQTGQFPVVRRGEPQWLDGQRFTLAKLSKSPEYRMVAQAERLEDAKALFWNSQTRQEMMANPDRRAVLETRAGSDRFIDEVAERIGEVTGGHPDLKLAVAHGRLNGVSLSKRDDRGNLRPNPKALAELRKYTEHLPEFTAVDEVMQVNAHGSAVVKGARAFEQGIMAHAFALFGSKPNNRFVNSPVFRQLYWQNVERIAPLATPADRARLIAQARRNNLDRATIKRLESITGDGGRLTVEDVNDLANDRAFYGWMDLVYDSHDKANWTKTVRMISPFAAAVADMYRVWAKQLRQNPLILHRVEQGMHGARQSGFFFTDENGEERFAYPMTRALSQVATGVGLGMSGLVKGANMITSSLIPSFGPVVTWPVSWFLPDSKDTDELRRLISPYGDPDASGGVLEGLMPAHVQKLLAAAGLSTPSQRRAYENALGDTQAYLATSGGYDLSDPGDLRRLRDDAKAKGKALWIIRALAQGGAPASPRHEWYAYDKDGRLTVAAHMAADWRRFMREDPDSANVRLFSKYGDSVFYVVTGTTTGGGFATEEAHDLIREHPHLEEEYGLVWALFTDPDSPYSFEEYQRQLKAGSREQRNLKEIQVAAQTALAGSMLRDYRKQVGPFPTAEGDAYLAMVRAELRKEFPLWRPDDFNVGEAAEKVRQVLAAADDPALRDTEVAEAVRVYAQYRQQVIQDANGRGLTASETGWGKAKATASHRAYMRSVAQKLIEKYPGFESIYDRVFANEMIEDQP